MPIRFSTQAANEDKLRDDAQPRNAPQGTPPAAGAGRRRERSEQAAQRDSAADNGAATKPGKDINAAGFVKDKDPDKA